MRPRMLALFLLAGSALAQIPIPEAIQRHAARFQEKARRAVSEETLLQRSYTLPPHSHFAIGAAAEPLFAQYFVHEIVSQYGVDSLHGDTTGNLLEFREIVSKDGRPMQTPAAARKALAM